MTIKRGGGEDLLTTTGILATKDTHSHIHTRLKKWEQSQGSGSATHGNHVSKNTATQSTADLSVAPEFSDRSINVEHFTTNSLQKVGFPHLDSSSH